MKIHYRNYWEIPTEVINKPKCLQYNELLLESGNKIKTVRRTVKLETGEYSTVEENKPVMMHADTIEHLENLQQLVSVLLDSCTKTA